MRIRAIAVPLLLAVIGAGCGSNSTKTNSTEATGTTAAGGTVPSRSYTVKLSGAAEVPKGATGGGTATISIRGAKQQLCWTFHLTGVPQASAAHVHTGPAGASGPVLIPLGSRYNRTGCASVSKAELTMIVAAPKNYYVNVHNATYPNGAARAQL